MFEEIMAVYKSNGWRETVKYLMAKYDMNYREASDYTRDVQRIVDK